MNNNPVKREIIVYYKKLGNKVTVSYVYSEVSNFLFSDKAFLNEFITTNGIEKMSLAAKYDVAKNVMIDTLSGRLRTPQAHKIILKIIDDFKLR